MSHSVNQDIHVKIGEVKISGPGNRLKATLGSCVGIAFLWKKEKLFGLAHCLLPSSEVIHPEIGAKYVPQAIISLLKLMKIEKCNYKEVDVVLAGGGNMLAQLSISNLNQVGELNSKAAREILNSLGFSIIMEDLGGTQGRQIFIDCTEATIEINKILKI